MSNKLDLVRNSAKTASDVCNEMRERGMGVVCIVENESVIASMGYELTHYNVDDIESNPKWKMACLIAAGQSAFENCDLIKNYRIILLNFLGMLFSGSNTAQWVVDHSEKLTEEAGKGSVALMEIAARSFEKSSAEQFDDTPPEAIIAALYMLCAKHKLDLSEPRIPLKVLVTEVVTHFCESTPVGEMVKHPDEIGDYVDNIITMYMRSRKDFSEGYYRDARRKMH